MCCATKGVKARLKCKGWAARLVKAAIIKLLNQNRVGFMVDSSHSQYQISANIPNATGILS